MASLGPFGPVLTDLEVIGRRVYTIKAKLLSPDELYGGDSVVSESEITEADLYDCQTYLDSFGLSRIDDLDGRVSLCKKLVSLTNKKAKGLVESDAYALWSRAVEDPGRVSEDLYYFDGRD